MNIHPAFVHFPISLLFLYSVIEICVFFLRIIIVRINSISSCAVPSLQKTLNENLNSNNAIVFSDESSKKQNTVSCSRLYICVSRGLCFGVQSIFSKIESSSVFNIKLFLLIVGVCGAYLTLLTRNPAIESIIRSGVLYSEFVVSERGQLINLHVLLTQIVVWIYSIITLAYIVKYFLQKSFFTKVTVVQSFSKIILTPVVLMTLVCIGWILLVITSVFSLAIAYGPNIDSVVHFVYSMFF